MSQKIIDEKVRNFKASMNFAMLDTSTGTTWEICFNYDNTVTSLTCNNAKNENSFIDTAQPLIALKNDPQILNSDELAQFLKDKKVLIYTGAGVSAGIVPTMTEIMSGLGIAKNDKESFLDIFHKSTHTAVLVEFMQNFFSACVNGMPSRAHHAITQLALNYKWSVVTENLDLLHEKAGLDVIKRAENGHQFTNPEIISTEYLNQIDVILCMGLATDESGLLNTFRQQNFKGVIVAINLQIPEYLSSQDIFLAGNVQYLVPQLLHDLQKIN